MVVFELEQFGKRGPDRRRFKFRHSLRALLLLASVALLCVAEHASAQAYEPDIPANSPLALLEAPKDPIAYFERKQQARDLVQKGRGVEAEPIAQRLVREYPRDGENWLLLAKAQKALAHHAEAALAFEKAGSMLGWDGVENEAFLAAAEYLAAGDRASSMRIIRKDILENRSVGRSDYLEAPELAALRSDPEFLAVVGSVPADHVTRVTGWNRDLDYLTAEIKRVNPDFRSSPLPPEFERRLEKLRADLSTLTDEQIVVRINAAMHVLHQGHTGMLELRHPQSLVPNTLLPLQVYLFPEGVYVVNALDGYKQLIGARVLKIGDVPAVEAWKRLNQLQSADGDMEYVWLTAVYMTRTNLLVGLNIVKSADDIPMTFERHGQKFEMHVAAAKDRSPWQLPPPSDIKVQIVPRDADQAHWVRSLPKQQALFVAFNGVHDDAEDTLMAFGRRLWSEIVRNHPRNLILDMRLNQGGNTALYPQLLRTLIAFTRTQGNHLYVIIGRRTYSAAGNFITQLDQLAEPIFVGEPSSECCKLNGDASAVTLPYSKIQGRLTGVKWNLSDPWDARREIVPEVPVTLYAQDYFAGRDPALETIEKLIARSWPCKACHGPHPPSGRHAEQ